MRALGVLTARASTHRIIIKMQRLHANTNFFRYHIEIRGIDEISVIIGISYEQNIAGRWPYFTDYTNGIRDGQTGRCYRTQHKTSAVL